MATQRMAKCSVALVLLSATVFLSACGGIDSGNIQRSASARLTPKPPVILVEPFSADEGSFLVKRAGYELEMYKRELTTGFQDVLIERLQKIGPAKKAWQPDGLPERGWLIKGEFLRVYAGSGFLRDVVGFGAGQSVFTARVYVYDLSVSTTAYIMSFETGISDDQKGSGSYQPGILAAGGVSGAIARGAGADTGLSLMTGGATAGAAATYAELSTRPFPNPTQAEEMNHMNANQFTNQYQDMARTARQIRDTLVYLSGGSVDKNGERVAMATTSTKTSSTTSSK